MRFRLTEYLKAFTRSPKALVGIFIVGILIILSLAAPLLAPYDPYEIHVENTLARPSRTHLLGTDHLGRDTLSQVIYGTRTSLLISCAGAFLAYGIGLALGIIAAYKKGIIENLILVYFDSIRSFPTIILILAIVAMIGPSVRNIVLIFGVTYSALFGRTVRAIALSVCEEPFIEAAISMGSKTRTILFKHIVSNVVGPTIVIGGMYIPFLIISEAGLAFLGLGVPPPTASWGTTIRWGFQYITRAWWLIIMPSFALGLTVLGFNWLAEGARDIIDPEKRSYLLTS